MMIFNDAVESTVSIDMEKTGTMRHAFFVRITCNISSKEKEIKQLEFDNSLYQLSHLILHGHCNSLLKNFSKGNLHAADLSSFFLSPFLVRCWSLLLLKMQYLGFVARGCILVLLPGSVSWFCCQGVYLGFVARDCILVLLPEVVSWFCCQGLYFWFCCQRLYLGFVARDCILVLLPEVVSWFCCQRFYLVLLPEIVFSSLSSEHVFVARYQNLAMFQWHNLALLPVARTWLCCQWHELGFVASGTNLALLPEAKTVLCCQMAETGFVIRDRKLVFLLRRSWILLPEIKDYFLLLEVRTRLVFSVSSLVISLLQLTTFNSGCSNTVIITSHIVHFRGQNMVLLPEIRTWPSFQRSELFFYFFF